MFATIARRARAPIPVHGVSGNYAQAVYSAAVAKNSKPQVAKDLEALNGAMANAKISDFMSDPFVDSKKKLSILSEVAAKTKMSPLTVNFFSVLAENNRLGMIAEISDIYARIIKAEAGFTPVTVTSAVKMSAAQEKEVAAAVKAIVGGDAVVDLQSEVDADIVGGLIVSIGDKYTTMQHIDLSTSSKIQKFSGLLKQGV
jgi:F-type H+-transporting ATPase subunit O